VRPGCGWTSSSHSPSRRERFPGSCTSWRSAAYYLPLLKTSTLHSSALGRTAAVVRDRRHVLDHVDLQARRLQRTDRRLASGTRALDVNLDGLEAVLHRSLRGRLGSRLRGEGRRLLG